MRGTEYGSDIQLPRGIDHRALGGLEITRVRLLPVLGIARVSAERRLRKRDHVYLLFGGLLQPGTNLLRAFVGLGEGQNLARGDVELRCAGSLILSRTG